MKAQIYNFSVWIDETDPLILKKVFKKMLQESDFLILQMMDHHFKPFGYTVIFMLSESHFAIHTFPENKQTYIELSSCVKEPFDKFIKNYNRLKI